MSSPPKKCGPQKNIHFFFKVFESSIKKVVDPLTKTQKKCGPPPKKFFFWDLLKKNCKNKLKKNCIGATIRIGPEIQYLPYTGYFLQHFSELENTESNKCWDTIITPHHFWDYFFFSELKFLDSSLSYFLLCTGARV